MIKDAPATESTARMQDELTQYPELLRELLQNRGITTKAEAEIFLNPRYEDLFDPFLIKDMDRAVDRILRALQGNERIAIWSDYDCDGIPGGVLLHDFFKKIEYPHFQNYIPHRHEEGYGLNIGGIEKLKYDGVSLIITVDVGITDIEKVAHANSLKMDVIVTDHHLPGSILPPAYAVVNSKRADDAYPFKELCGSGVAFKLVQALIKRGNFGLKEGWEKWLLDVAGIATIADMVPLVGENRILAYFGLQVLRKSRRPGLQQLCRKMNVTQRDITEDDIGFMIAPRINAASRMDRPDEAFHLLATDSEVEGGVYAEHLHKINNERKGVVASMVKEIKKEISARATTDGIIVMGNPKWKPALLGLVANTLVEEYGKTVCLWGEEGGNILKGSCRSNGEVNVVEMMTYSKEVLIEYGGHKFSGGFSVTREQVHLLPQAFVEAHTSVKVDGVAEEVCVDKKLHVDDVTWETYRTLEKLAPFGMGNPKPTFLFENVTVSRVRQFGKEKNHLEIQVTHGGKSVPAIAFFTSPESFGGLQEGKRIHLIANIERSTFGRVPQLRLRIISVT